MEQDSSWIVCQIGARENYSIARALERQNRLEALVTDLWCPPSVPFSSLLGRIGERSHPELSKARVWAPTLQAVGREIGDRSAGRTGWPKLINRNKWFQNTVCRHLAHLRPDGPVTLFAYSYAATTIFEEAKSRGWRTVLGQIDPGPIEARMVDRLYNASGQGDQHESIPPEYWDSWRREIDLADVIMVNSDWSRQGLIEEGADPQKIAVVPLAYEPVNTPHPSVIPEIFTPQRPMRLLFLGQVTLRKGIDLVLDAMALLPSAPIHLDIVGPVQVDLPDVALQDPRITFHGSVPRSSASEFYAKADVFLFPTRSDGFGLTQLEAKSAGLPIIASDRCGSVVEDGVNGLVLGELEPQSLATLIERLVGDPFELANLSQAARLDDRFSIESLGSNLMALANRDFSALR